MSVFAQSGTQERLAWFATLTLTLLYVGIEFGFNFQPLNLTVISLSEEVLFGLEFWGRVISGVGFGLVLYRYSSGLRFGRLTRLWVCLLGSIIVMWYLQSAITDYLVSEASRDDKVTAGVLANLSRAASQGTLDTLSGNQLLPPGARLEDQKTAASLFPAMALYVPNRVQQLAAWTGVDQAQMETAFTNHYSDAQLSIAYRNLIVPPLTLGVSLFFALLNLAQLISYCIFGLSLKNPNARMRMCFCGVVLWFSFLLFSTLAPSPLVRSNAYQLDLRASLFKEDMVLGVLTEWATHVTPNWYFLSYWRNSVFLRGVNLRRPY